jgi:dienelactone hydrolase
MRLLLGIVSTVLALLAISPAHAQDKIGVILMHGKQSTPTATPGLNVIASNLQSAGHLVVAPTMPWARGAWESINVTVDQVLATIDGHAAALRGQGATRIVIGGQSLGANIALSYAVERGNVAGVVMLSPGHNPIGTSRGPTGKDIERARALVDAGKGGESFTGGDNNQGDSITMRTTAAVYLSWLGPRGKASMQAQAPKLPANIPLLMVIGEGDRSFAWMKGAVYDPAAKHTYSKYATNGGNHGTAALAASKLVTEWIVALPK